MTGTEKGILFLDPNQEDIILQEAPITGKTSSIIEVRADSTEVTANPVALILHLGFQSKYILFKISTALHNHSSLGSLIPKQVR